MYDLVIYTVFFVSIFITISSTILIARKLFGTGVEYFSGRILVISGIINISLCIGLLFFQTISNSSISTSARFICGLLAILIPARVFYNYLTQPKRITKQFDLIPHKDQTVIKTILPLLKSMGISSPEFFSSDSVQTPFVFGRHSSKASLAVPVKWDIYSNPHNYSILLHELAHIRNHDVGFLAWSQAYIKDLKWILIGLPALIILIHLLELHQIAPSIYIYFSCLLTLYAMLRYIIRTRELLADSTAALLIKSDHITQAISSHSSNDYSHDIKFIQNPRINITQRLYQWFTDKALFSKHTKYWKIILQVFSFFHVSHPDRLKRIENILETNKIVAKPHTNIQNSFWAGVTLGFLGVVVGLCGYWLSGPIRYAPDDTDSLLLSHTLYGLAAVPAIGFWVVFVTLPSWSSLGKPNMDKSFFRLLVKHHFAAFIGSFAISMLLLTAMLIQMPFMVLFILCIFWQLLIVAMGFCVSVVSVFLWNVARYLQTSDVKGLSKVLWTFVPLLTVALGSTFLGMHYLSSNKTFQGANLIFSTLMGIIISFHITGRSRFSMPDHYIIISGMFFNYHIEGKRFLKQYKLIDTIIFPSLLILPILMSYLTCSFLFSSLSDKLTVRWTVITLIIIGCIALVLIQLAERKKSTLSMRVKIFRLFHSMQLLSIPQSNEIFEKIIYIFRSIISKDIKSFKKPNLTMHDIYQIFLITNQTHPEFKSKAVQWTMQCARPGGFGLWPKSGPRLISTYKGLEILEKSDQINNIDPLGHISWIKSLQQQDGSFKSPWSTRDLWEETFFAIKSLYMLKSSLDYKNTPKCAKYCKSTLQEGIDTDQPEMVYYSIGTLEALNKLDRDTIDNTSRWLMSNIEKLLLANIGLNYENIHFVVMTYYIISKTDSSAKIAGQIKLLAKRVQAALDAELTDIHL